MAAKTIYLLRHGDVASRYAGRFIGRTNVPLSRAGRRQACRLARRFGNLAGLACVASPLRRARDTARLAVPGMNGDLKIWPGLREIDFGRWEGLTFDEIRRRDPARVNDWARFGSDFRFPEGESLRSFRRRLNDLARRILSHPARKLLVVSHGGVIRSLICVWSGKPLRRYPEVNVAPGSVAVVRVRHGRARVDSIGDPVILKR